jgi:hypothetical protein
LACGGKEASGPKPPAYSHTEEVHFHLGYFYYDSAGNPVRWSTVPNGMYPDTAMIRWWKGAADSSSGGLVLGQVGITGNDSLCALLVVTSDTIITKLTLQVGWRRHGVTSFSSSYGPYDPTNTADWGPYWDVITGEDTLAGSVFVTGDNSRTTSFCSAGMRKDSIMARG